MWRGDCTKGSSAATDSVRDVAGAQNVGQSAVRLFVCGNLWANDLGKSVSAKDGGHGHGPDAGE